MSKVTATIKTATARVITVNILTDHNAVKRDDKVVSVPAYDEVVTLFGDFQNSKSFLTAIQKKYKNATAFAVVGLLANSFTTSEVKYEIDESVFIENAKILKDGDSRIGLITRNIKSYKVTYTAITSEKEFKQDSCYVSSLIEKRMKNEIDEDAKNKGYVVVFSNEKPIESESLYGMDKDKFIELGKAAQ